MKRTNRTRGATAIAAAAFAILAVFGASALAQHLTPPVGKKEYQFKGKVEKVDTRGRTVMVNNEAIEGWMAAMSMSYKVDKAEVLKTLKAGDQITARVFDGNVDTLFDVKVVPPKEEKK
jgi:Cu/Ag efflux protein CusF